MMIKRGCAAIAAAVMLTACGSTEENEPHITTLSKPTETSASTTAASAAATSATTVPTAAETTVTTTTTKKKTTKKTTAAVTTTTVTTTTEEITTPEPVVTDPPVIETEPVIVTEETQTVTQPPVQTTPPADTTPKETVSETEKPEEKPEEKPAPDPDPSAPPTTLFFVNTGEKETVINWDPSEGADGYEVLMKKDKNSKWELLGDTKKQTFTVTGIGLDRNYIFTVKAYKLIDGKKLYSDRSRNCGFPYMTKKNGVTYVDGIMVVNKTYGLPADYGWGLTADTQAAFNEMQAGARADGLSIWICSGFRSYSYQSTLYWNYVARDGSQWSADRYSARPGYSEHQSGYAIDVNQASRWFNGSPVAIWLEKNCWKYGFIIRYPYGKEDVTGYNYESWHCRYVGKEKAKRLTESGLTIEEYYGLTSVYS